MNKISLKCEQCGGDIVLDDSREVGTCEHCSSRFVIKQEQIVQNITQTVNKYVYGVDNKDIEELLTDAHHLLDLGEDGKANTKFGKALSIDSACWEAWMGYASTGGDRSNYLSSVSAYITAYNVATTDEQEQATFATMVEYIPDHDIRTAFIRSFASSTGVNRTEIFNLVSGVIGCDESEIAALAIDICPDDWRTHFAMAKIRKIRVRWCKKEGNFLIGKRLPAHAVEVLNIFMRTYRLAKKESETAKREVVSYINELSRDSSYSVFIEALLSEIAKEK